jgi:hypothetical protein
MPAFLVDMQGLVQSRFASIIKSFAYEITEIYAMYEESRVTIVEKRNLKKVFPPRTLIDTGTVIDGHFTPLSNALRSHKTIWTHVSVITTKTHNVSNYNNNRVALMRRMVLHGLQLVERWE